MFNLNSKFIPFGNYDDAVPDRFMTELDIPPLRIPDRLRKILLGVLAERYVSRLDNFFTKIKIPIIKLPFWLRQLGWWGRNPLHNFTAYWIGIRGRVVTRPDKLFREGDGVVFQTVSSKLLKLPLVSYRGRYVEWYLGWRPNGMFGGAFRRSNATGF